MGPHEEDDLRINEPTNASRLERDMVQSSDHMFNQSSIQMANDGTPGMNARFADGPVNLLDSPNQQENNFGASDDEQRAHRSPAPSNIMYHQIYKKLVPQQNTEERYSPEMRVNKQKGSPFAQYKEEYVKYMDKNNKEYQAALRRKNKEMNQRFRQHEEERAYNLRMMTAQRKM